MSAAAAPTTPSVTAVGAEPGPLPPLQVQAERLVSLGLHLPAELEADDLVARARTLEDRTGALLVLDRRIAPASALAPLLRLGALPGFVVEDMTDVDAFAPVDGIDVPDAPLYVVDGIDRGDDLRGWSPDEADVEIAARGRTRLLLTEGLHWALQATGVVAPNHCLMTSGSRVRRADGRLDARTPALWISGGTGRDGRERRGAPKIGWCWAGNRHTWLGIGSATGRRA
ncbi:DUF5701 family protein [Cellulomonas composti]|uniref:Uncharacterized protein n=1 Tax=Cellulomonas composti TaxID=266130 RepID=A0A511J796_9CELL|nr:DUF5701 family protein [Cellulomonas composti]GEL93854.1 hypothetical protein CCO02nite_05120 [Cellulomonas composti]